MFYLLWACYKQIIDFKQCNLVTKICTDTGVETILVVSEDSCFDKHVLTFRGNLLLPSSEMELVPQKLRYLSTIADGVIFRNSLVRVVIMTLSSCVTDRHLHYEACVTCWRGKKLSLSLTVEVLCQESRVLLEEPEIAQMVMKVSVLYIHGIRSFMNVCTRTRHWAIYWNLYKQSTF